MLPSETVDAIATEHPWLLIVPGTVVCRYCGAKQGLEYIVRQDRSNLLILDVYHADDCEVAELSNLTPRIDLTGHIEDDENQEGQESLRQLPRCSSPKDD